MKDNIRLLIQMALIFLAPLLAKHHITVGNDQIDQIAAGLALVAGVISTFAHWWKSPPNPNLVALPPAGQKAGQTAAKLPIALLLAGLVCRAAMAQTAIPSTSWGEIGQGVIGLGETVISAMPTNIAIAPYGTVILNAQKQSTTSSTAEVERFVGRLHNRLRGDMLHALAVGGTSSTTTKFGGGLLAAYNLSLGPVMGGPAVAVDYVDSFTAFNGGVNFGLPIKPLSFLGMTNFAVVPTTIDMVGTPLGGTGNTSATVETAVSGGAYFSFGHVWGGSLFAGGLYGTRSGAGAYNGTYLNGFGGWTKSF